MNNESLNIQNTPFEFRGNASDFFQIWFVNTIFTVITFGIYGAWAKVRNNRYIYSNTFLGNHPFEYTANPVKILIGRLIVVGIYAAFFIASELMFIGAAAIIFIIFIFLIPLIIRQSLIFNAKYTRFHGLNFRYRASVGDFYKFFLFHTFLNLITIGIIFPYTHSEFKKLVINHTYYGNSNFYFQSQAPQFFFIYYVKIMLLYVVLFVVVVLSTVALLAITRTGIEELNNGGVLIILGTISLMLYFGVIIFSFILRGSFEAWIGRVVYNNTSIKEYRMLNEWNAFKLSWIYLSNFFVIIVSLGLLYPWTKIRTVKYKLENIGFENLNLNTFDGQIEQDRSAVGEEAADFFDFDIGF
ncbi:MAG: DUF898 domain-containing protein [Campylobacteraceae bacterium]|jgi:uncharacterized membrane protein YjgN (DUF898 family)|nr:DUF898 domain-containing protein [Campylobacteraceae bacterium]